MVEKNIVEKVNKAFTPDVFYIENESHMHSGPRTESHFKLYVVSSQFDEMSRVERQRAVNDLLSEEFEGGLHALSLRLKTKVEHEKNGVGDFVSPTCASKNKVQK